MKRRTKKGANSMRYYVTDAPRDMFSEKAEREFSKRLDSIIRLLETMMEKEEKEDSKDALTIPAETADSVAVINLLKKVRPAVAGIKDKKTKAKVTDALLSAVLNRTTNAKAVTMDAARRDVYEQLCEKSEAAYAARNPHRGGKAHD